MSNLGAENISVHCSVLSNVYVFDNYPKKVVQNLALVEMWRNRTLVRAYPLEGLSKCKIYINSCMLGNFTSTNIPYKNVQRNMHKTWKETIKNTHEDVLVMQGL